MQIIPNPIEAAVLTIPFLIAFTSLWFILWRPLLEYLDERKAISDTARREAEEYTLRSTERMSALEQQLTTAQAEISVLRAEARSRAVAAEQKILAEARADAEEAIDDALTSITAEKDRARTTLQAASDGIAGAIVTQVLAR